LALFINIRWAIKIKVEEINEISSTDGIKRYLTKNLVRKPEGTGVVCIATGP
jgi:hypothetical protein